MLACLEDKLEASTRKLRDASRSNRLEALRFLRDLARYNPDAIVWEAVGNPHEEVRVSLFQLLGLEWSRVGCTLRDIPILARGLEDPVAVVRVAAFQWLRGAFLFLGVFSQGDLELFEQHGLKPRLVNGVEDPDADVRTVAFQCLGRLPLGLQEDFEQHVLKPKLAEGLEDPVAEVRAAAFQCLEDRFFLDSPLKEVNVQLETSICKLRDTSPSTRSAALETVRSLAEKPWRNLVKKNPRQQDLCNKLVLEAVGNPHEEVRLAMFDLLGQEMLSIGDDNSLELLEGLEDPAADVRVAACLRAAGFECLSKYPECLEEDKDLETIGLKPKLVKGLGDSVAEVRASAFQCLGSCASFLQEDLETHGLQVKLMKGLEDPVATVRASAFQWLGTSSASFFWQNLETHGLILFAGLKDRAAEVRLAAFNAIQQCPSSSHLRQYLEGTSLKLKLLEGLKDPVAEVRTVAFQCLGRLPLGLQEDFEPHVLKPKVAEGLEDPVAEVRVAAFQCLDSFSPGLQQDLEHHGLKLKLVKGVEDPDADVRVAALQCLGKSPLPLRLCKECDWKLKLANGRADRIEKVRSAACKTLEKLRQNLGLDQCIVEHIKGLESLYPDVFDEAFEDLEQRNTWLHIAAQCGCTTVCQALLASGLAMKSLRNAKHQTASDVARLHGHDDLACDLSPSTFQTRGGTGGAIAKALDSDDVVEEVSWWFIPLPGWEGKVGAVHSILKVDTGKDQYLFEGACPEIERVKREGSQREEIERAAENGLFISNWTEIEDAANVQKLPDVKPCCPSGILLAALVKHLLQQGPYDVGSNNCHHTALRGYNFCATEKLQGLPVNAALTNVAWFFSNCLNIDVALSRSCGEPLPSKPMYTGIPRDENVTLELPRHWTGQVRNGAVDLERNSDEFLRVEANLKENGGDKIPGFLIIDIKRNQSLKMLRTFRNELYDMHEQRQLRVFHSAGDAHDAVMKEGFKDAYPSMKFNAYGAGHYFAQDLRLPDHFSPKSDAGVKQVLLCCVAVGKSHVKERIFPFVPGDRWSGKSQSEWTSQLIEPEHRQAPDGYDSCIAESREALIVYRGSQVLWEYAIQYQSTGSAGNPYGDLRGFLIEVPQN
eukprot:Skav227463  [mRNA]  locus=scaffold2491:285599:289176:+ [translate_table: standard]